MGQCAVAQRKPPWRGNPFARVLAAYDLGGEKEILNLFFGKSSLVRGPDNMWADQTNHGGSDDPPPLLMKCVHRSPPEFVPTKSTRLTTIRQPKIWRGRRCSAVQIEIYSPRDRGYSLAYLSLESVMVVPERAPLALVYGGCHDTFDDFAHVCICRSSLRWSNNPGQQQRSGQEGGNRRGERDSMAGRHCPHQ